MADDMNNDGLGSEETAGMPDDLKRLLARAEEDEAEGYDPDAESEEDEEDDGEELEESFGVVDRGESAGEDINGGSLQISEFGHEMKQSFIEYSMSVITARALPDVRDGLKPVHRRILYAMYESGILPNRPHSKSARTVGDVIGKYHPHGDSAVYETMVRLAQPFSMRVPLVDGHGNFGSIDGDSAAAMRYTEARLARPAMEMLRDLDKETVDWQPNYDESLREPVVLPARFPNLLVNGSQGIAVGMATNIPTHNLGETIDATILMMENPDCTTQDLMKVMPGPDFPTGAIICGKKGIVDAYETGRGSLTLRARCEISETKRGRSIITVKEIPYMVNRTRLLEKIGELIREKQLPEISNVHDGADRHGIDIIIELKQNALPQVVLNKLYKHTQLQTTFGCNMLALVDGVPRTLTLREMLQYYIDHQIDVVTRRTQFDLDKALKDVHIKEGLLIAVDNIDEIVHIIRSSETEVEAKHRMNERFGLDDPQCDAILAMRLRKLTGLAREQLAAEIEELHKLIDYYRDLLAHREKILGVIKDELGQIVERFADKRRTSISSQEAQDLDVEDLIAEEDMVVTVTHSGYIKRLPVATYRSQRRGGKGVQGLSLKDNDFVEDLFVASTHDYVMFFTNFGRVYRLKVHELPIGSRQARGSAIVNVLSLSEGEHPTAVITCRDFPADDYLMFATKNGMVKKTAMSEYDRTRRDGLIAINLKSGDELVNVRRVRAGDKVILVTTDGKGILFDESDVRAMGRDTSGVRGITLKGGASMLGMEITNGNGDLFVITENGYGKRTPVADYPEHKRGGQGVFTIAMTAKKGNLVACRVVGPQHELMIVSVDGVVIRVKTSDIPKLGRSTQGVKVMNLAESDHVSAVARMVAHKKKAPKHDANQGMLDLAAAGAKDADEEESVDIGGDEEVSPDLLDEDE